jgi:DNA-binding transcriptional LysR family regulator
MTRPSLKQRAGLESDTAPVDVRRLRYFVAVAEELHFTRAARRMGITQSSLSAAIQRLEAEYGVPLLRRSTRRVALTRDGARLLHEARALLRAVDRFEARSPRMHGLRVGSCPPARAGLVDPIVEESLRGGFTEIMALREEFSGALLRALDEGALDVAVTLGTEAEAPGRGVERLVTVPLQVALAPGDPLSGRSQLQLGELANLALYVFGDEDTAGSRDVAVRACQAAGFEPELVAARYAYANPQLDAGRTFALMPAVPDLRWTSKLAVVPLEEPAPTISFDLVWREGGGEAVETFVSAARRARVRWDWLDRS